MSTTTQKFKDTAKDFQDSANQLWLASLGVISSAQEESEKVFDNLVKQGQDFENKTSQGVRQQVQVAESRIQNIRNRAEQSLEKLEEAFELRVKQLLQKLGIPTREDLQLLNQQIEELRAALTAPKKRIK